MEPFFVGAKAVRGALLRGRGEVLKSVGKVVNASEMNVV